jgi:hypothetical protein
MVNITKKVLTFIGRLILSVHGTETLFQMQENKAIE